MDTKHLSALQAIRSQKEQMTALLAHWSDQNSHTDNVEGVLRMATLIEDAFVSLGGDNKRIAIPPRKKTDAKGGVENCPQGDALQITKRPTAPIQVLLAGHMDTVFPISSPFQHATIGSSRIVGPGVADMKGGLLVMLKALETLEKADFRERVGWRVLITPDEETGSCGSEPLYKDAAGQYHVGLIFEPSFPDGTLVSSRKGSKNISVKVKGKAAHVGRDFYNGKNALTALSRWLLNVERLTDQVKGITVNIGQICGGEAFNIVPDLATAKVNIRMDSPADDSTIDDCLCLLAEEANAQEGIDLTFHTEVSRRPKVADASCEHLFSSYKECARELGICLHWKPTGGVCDGNILASCGLPTLDTLGVIGGNLHTSQEYAEIDSLPERACLTALYLLKLAAGEILPPSKGQKT